MTDVITLVTINGECFQAEFKLKEPGIDRPGTYYYFRLKDLTEKNRGDLLVSLFVSERISLFVQDYESRIEVARLTFIRRAFDNGKLSFNPPNKPDQYQILCMESADFLRRLPVNDVMIRQYVVHKAYWLGYRHGSNARKLFVQFDEENDQDYLGGSPDDIGRSVWLLREQGLLQKTELPGVSLPTAKLIQEYGSKNGGTLSISAGEVIAADPSQLDALLGIPLRGQLEQRLLELVATANSGCPFSVLWIDLDDFKPINDTYGHAVGDEVLQKITSVIKTNCDGKGQPFRYGGDELIVILPNHNLREATATAERLREAISQTSFVNCREKITSSIGVACCQDTTREPKQILEEADKAMYEAKGSGGDGVSVSNALGLEALAPSNTAAKANRSDIAPRVDAAELWMTLQTGYHSNFVLIIENRSDDEVTIESITLKHGTVHLCPPSKPSKLEELVLPPHSKKQVSSWTPSVSPTSTLRMKLPDLKNGQITEIEIAVGAKVLGRKRFFLQTILVTVDYVNQHITQFGG
jgi:diguanylate cyclase (GGDEF)-like protein